MPIYLGNTEIGKELVDSYELGNVYLGANQIGFGSNGQIKSNTLIGNFNTWDTTSYSGSGSIWNNIATYNNPPVIGSGSINLINSPTFTQQGGYFPTNYFTMTTSSYGSGSLFGIQPPDNIMMQAWVYTPGINDTRGLISLGDEGASGANMLGIGVRTNGNIAVYFRGQSLGFAANNTLNQWVNIAVTTGTTSFNGYVNGVKVGTTTFGSSAPYNGSQRILVGSDGGTYNVGQILVSTNTADAFDDVIYNNYFATKQYFGY
jgi:hypothetical protein